MWREWKILFENHSAYGKFTDEMIGSEWWKEQIIKAAGSAYPELADCVGDVGNCVWS